MGGRNKIKLCQLDSLSISHLLPRPHIVLCHAERQRQNRQHGVESAVGHMHGSVSHEEIVMPVYLSPLIHNGSTRVVAHAARPGLMLSAAGLYAASRKRLHTFSMTNLLYLELQKEGNHDLPD